MNNFLQIFLILASQYNADFVLHNTGSVLLTCTFSDFRACFVSPVEEFASKQALLMVKGIKSNLKYKKFHLNIGEKTPFTVKLVRCWKGLHRERLWSAHAWRCSKASGTWHAAAEPPWSLGRGELEHFQKCLQSCLL